MIIERPYISQQKKVLLKSQNRHIIIESLAIYLQKSAVLIINISLRFPLGHLDVVKLLVESGANVNATDR